eukprot:gnl/TRDRNA2_/TRDRNA2_169590_c2_seq5.p1 gnl/TRDRNA2_/TRDRNA2_169590_c2~~gnl/TRDRNA2_/TRDRNA2_169590_c2_seq5.p1  ORF type:complete len:428 (+),score=82.10 gnl/TRDRNA2_/TRDRNA2_169590_c2_seq5:101-1285(+)
MTAEEIRAAEDRAASTAQAVQGSMEGLSISSQAPAPAATQAEGATTAAPAEETTAAPPEKDSKAIMSTAGFLIPIADAYQVVGEFNDWNPDEGAMEYPDEGDTESWNALRRFHIRFEKRSRKWPMDRPIRYEFQILPDGKWEKRIFPMLGNAPVRLRDNEFCRIGFGDGGDGRNWYVQGTHGESIEIYYDTKRGYVTLGPPQDVYQWKAWEQPEEEEKPPEKVEDTIPEEDGDRSYEIVLNDFKGDVEVWWEGMASKIRGVKYGQELLPRGEKTQAKGFPLECQHTTCMTVVHKSYNTVQEWKYCLELKSPAKKDEKKTIKVSDIIKKGDKLPFDSYEDLSDLNYHACVISGLVACVISGLVATVSAMTAMNGWRKPRSSQEASWGARRPLLQT